MLFARQEGDGRAYLEYGIRGKANCFRYTILGPSLYGNGLTIYANYT